MLLLVLLLLVIVVVAVDIVVALALVVEVALVVTAAATSSIILSILMLVLLLLLFHLEAKPCRRLSSTFSSLITSRSFFTPDRRPRCTLTAVSRAPIVTLIFAFCFCKKRNFSRMCVKTCTVTVFFLLSLLNSSVRSSIFSLRVYKYIIISSYTRKTLLDV